MANPTLYDHTATANARIPYLGPVASGLTIEALNPADAGLLVIPSVMVGYASGANPTISCTDNLGNTYTPGPAVDDTTNLQKCAMFYLRNAPTGITHWIFSFSELVDFFEGMVSRFYNIDLTAAAEASHGASGTSTTWQPGSFTPLTNGDLIYNVAWNYGAFPAGLTSLAGDTGFTPLNFSRHDGHCAQYKVQATAGAINPAFTVSNSLLFFSLGIAFKSAAAPVSVPPVRVVRRAVYTFPSNDITTSFTEQFPCDTGNTLLMAWDGYGNAAPPGCHLTAVSDTSLNLWKLTTPTDSPPPRNPGTSQFAYVENATVSTSLVVTGTLNIASQDTVVTLWEVAGLLSNSFDQVTTAADDQEVPGDVTTVSISPSRPSGIVFLMGQVADGSVTGVTDVGSTVFFDCATFPEESASNPEPLEQNNARAHVFPANTTQITFVWQTTNAPGGVGPWSAQAISFLAPPPAATYEQEGFQYRADDGDEADDSNLGSQDVDVSRANLNNTRLRILSNVTNNPSGEKLKLQYRRVGDEQWRDV